MPISLLYHSISPQLLLTNFWTFHMTEKNEIIEVTKWKKKSWFIFFLFDRKNEWNKGVLMFFFWGAGRGYCA